MPQEEKPTQPEKKTSVVRTVFGGLLHSYFSDNLSKASAELSYYLLFSIFPLLIVVGSLLAVTNISEVTLLQILRLLPGDIQRIISPVITRYFGQMVGARLVWQIVWASLLATYFLSRTMSSIMYNVNRIYNIPNRRGGIGQLIFEILSAAGFVFSIGCTFVLIILGRTLHDLVERFVVIPEQLGWMWAYGRYIFAIGIMFLFLLLVYYLAPNCIIRLRDAIPGTIFTVCVWIICTMAFTFYINNINRYGALYGSISAIMVLMLWMYMTGIILFLGFELNLILMKRRHMDFVCKDRPWYVRMGAAMISKLTGKRKEDSK